MAAPKPMTSSQEAEVAALQALPDDRIDTRDIPEQRDWSGARRGVFFRPIKMQLTLRLDADVIDWFRTHTANGEGYQTSINSALRAHVAQRREVGFDPPEAAPEATPEAANGTGRPVG